MGIPPVPDPGGLSDGVVTVRRYRDDDVANVVPLVNDTEIVRWTRVPADSDEASLRTWLATHEGLFERGAEAPLVVVDAASREIVGSNGFVHFVWERRIGEIGYWSAAGRRGQGLVVRATRLVAGWGFAVLGLTRVELRVHPENSASLRVAEAVGATREGVLRNGATREDGTPFDTVLFSLVPGDL